MLNSSVFHLCHFEFAFSSKNIENRTTVKRKWFCYEIKRYKRLPLLLCAQQNGKKFHFAKDNANHCSVTVKTKPKWFKWLFCLYLLLLFQKFSNGKDGIKRNHPKAGTSRTKIFVYLESILQRFTKLVTLNWSIFKYLPTICNILSQSEMHLP